MCYLRLRGFRSLWPLALASGGGKRVAGQVRPLNRATVRAKWESCWHWTFAELYYLHLRCGPHIVQGPDEFRLDTRQRFDNLRVQCQSGGLWIWHWSNPTYHWVFPLHWKTKRTRVHRLERAQCFAVRQYLHNILIGALGV